MRAGNVLGAGAPCRGEKKIDLAREEPVFISDGPSDYGDNVNCSWLITSPGPIEVVFLDFSTEKGYDYVRVSAEGLPPKDYSYSGSVVPGPVRTNQTVRSMTISFSSDGSAIADGFIAKVRVVQPGETASPSAAPTFPTAGEKMACAC
jgi:hypothetical protein